MLALDLRFSVYEGRGAERGRGERREGKADDGDVSRSGTSDALSPASRKNDTPRFFRIGTSNHHDSHHTSRREGGVGEKGGEGMGGCGRCDLPAWIDGSVVIMAAAVFFLGG